VLTDLKTVKVLIIAVALEITRLSTITFLVPIQVALILIWETFEMS
jgi:hypothetical protein